MENTSELLKVLREDIDDNDHSNEYYLGKIFSNSEYSKIMTYCDLKLFLKYFNDDINNTELNIQSLFNNKKNIQICKELTEIPNFTIDKFVAFALFMDYISVDIKYCAKIFYHLMILFTNNKTEYENYKGTKIDDLCNNVFIREIMPSVITELNFNNVRQTNENLKKFIENNKNFIEFHVNDYKNYLSEIDTYFDIDYNSTVCDKTLREPTNPDIIDDDNIHNKVAFDNCETDYYYQFDYYQIDDNGDDITNKIIRRLSCKDPNYTKYKKMFTTKCYIKLLHENNNIMNKIKDICLTVQPHFMYYDVLGKNDYFEEFDIKIELLKEYITHNNFLGIKIKLLSLFGYHDKLDILEENSKFYFIIEHKDKRLYKENLDLCNAQSLFQILMDFNKYDVLIKYANKYKNQLRESNLNFNDDNLYIKDILVDMKFFRSGGGGALMNAITYGPQDVYLAGNPQITLLKQVYRKSTIFSVE